MRKLSRRLFRPFEKAELTGEGGVKLVGRGEVVRLRESAGDCCGFLAHELGTLDVPLYVFTGCLDRAEPGDRMIQGGVEYTVLKAERITQGGADLGLRAVLERRGKTGEEGLQ